MSALIDDALWVRFDADYVTGLGWHGMGNTDNTHIHDGGADILHYTTHRRSPRGTHAYNHTFSPLPHPPRYPNTSRFHLPPLSSPPLLTHSPHNFISATYTPYPPPNPSQTFSQHLALRPGPSTPPPLYTPSKIPLFLPFPEGERKGLSGKGADMEVRVMGWV